MNKYCELEITCTAETALKKLKKADMPVYNCKKQGAFFIFSVKDKDIKKAFAIFAKPCYNIRVRKDSARKRFVSGAFLRAGLVFGALIFAAAAYISGFFVLGVEVTGSGSYLKEEVYSIVRDGGAVIGKPFSAFDPNVAAGKILALPDVVFCNIKKHGSVLVVDVQTEAAHPQYADRRPLVSDVDGKVKSITVICGVAAVAAGDEVFKGETLIEPYVLIGGKAESCMAVGYAELQCSAVYEYFAEDDSENSIKQAYASVLTEENTVISRSHKIYGEEKGVKIVIYVEYLHKVSINIT